MHRDILGIGLTGQTLTDFERRLLRDAPPYAIVLFGRNIAGPDQLRDLIAEVKRVAARPPVMMVDQEGGRVDRLRNLIPSLPSAEGFAEGENAAELAERFGHVTGIALRYFDIEVDLAPVVDIRGAQAPKGLERRTYGADPESVVELAGAFMRGLHAAGTASCPKHFPGIGGGSADTHYGSSVVEGSLEQLLQRELVPYARLANEAGAVMVGHGTYPQLDDEKVPASLSRRIAHDVLRGILHFDGIAITDDMEMHAVADLGTYESIAERALMAGDDCILFCTDIERVPALQEHLAKRVSEDPAVRARFEDAFARCEAFRAHCERLRAAGAPRARSFDAVIDEAARFVAEFEKTRPHREVVGRMSGKGRTGREEWT